eukprot:696303-Prymnesium_polylepis.1
MSSSISRDRERPHAAREAAASGGGQPPASRETSASGARAVRRCRDPHVLQVSATCPTTTTRVRVPHFLVDEARRQGAIGRA